MAKRVCAYCRKEIVGYPHVTVWFEGQEKSEGLRFHTLSEAVLYLVNKLKWKVIVEKKEVK